MIGSLGTLQKKFWIGWTNFRRWIADGWALWLVIAIITVIYLSAYNFPVERLFPDKFTNGPAEFSDRIRWFGILLEVFAIATIAYGLANSLAAFDKPRPLRRFLLWIAEFRYVFIPRPPIHALVNIKAGAATIAMAGGVAVMTGGTLEDRVAYVERSLKSLYESLGKVATEFKKAERELREALATEMKARQLADDAVRRELEDQAIGDANLQVAGLTLLFVSIIMANAPTESALFLHYMGLGHAAWW